LKGEIRISFNKIYKPVFTTRCRYIDIWGGRGRGGSHFGVSYFLFLITKPDYFRGVFCRYVFNDIRSSLYREFKDRVEENETLREEDFLINDNEMRIMYKPTGNMIMSLGVKADGGRTAKLKSIAGATHVLIEEADEVGEPDFSILNLSLRTVKVKYVQVIRIFNPPGKNSYLWNRYTLTDADIVDNGERVDGYFMATPKTDADTLSIWSDYFINLRNLQQSFVDDLERYRKTDPSYYWVICRGYISEGMRGRIFSGWQTMTNAEFNALDAVSIFGQDFGTSSPAAIVEIKIINNRLYIRELNYRPLSTRQIGTMYCQLGLTEKQIIVADSAEPLSIAQLRRGWKISELTENEAVLHPQLLIGFNIHPAHKGPGSIMAGISKMKGMEVFVTEDSVNLWKEYANYSWNLDRNRNPTDEPKDEFNHLIDAARMACMAKGRFY
jgi:phage terminase large subunit